MSEIPQRGEELAQRIAAGDTMAVIAAQEWLDELCDRAEATEGVDRLDIDYLSAVRDAGAGLLAGVLPVLYGVDEGDDSDANRIVEMYQLHGGRQVRYRAHRVVVWLEGSDPTRELFDRPE